MQTTHPLHGRQAMRRLIRERLRWASRSDARSVCHRKHYRRTRRLYADAPFSYPALWSLCRNAHLLPPDDAFFDAIIRIFARWWNGLYRSGLQVAISDLADMLHKEMRTHGYVNFSRIWALRLACLIIRYLQTIPGAII